MSRPDSLAVCPSDGRGSPHNFVRCAPWAPVHAFACSHCGAAVERGTGRYVSTAEAAELRAAAEVTP